MNTASATVRLRLRPATNLSVKLSDLGMAPLNSMAAWRLAITPLVNRSYRVGLQVLQDGSLLDVQPSRYLRFSTTNVWFLGSVHDLPGGSTKLQGAQNNSFSSCRIHRAACVLNPCGGARRYSLPGHRCHRRMRASRFRYGRGRQDERARKDCRSRSQRRSPRSCKADRRGYWH